MIDKGKGKLAAIFDKKEVAVFGGKIIIICAIIILFPINNMIVNFKGKINIFFIFDIDSIWHVLF